MKDEVRNHSFKTLERLIVMGILGLWLSPCWQWIPLHAKCNEVLFVGSAISRSIWARQIPLFMSCKTHTVLIKCRG